MSRALGRFGESWAMGYLTRQGYRIVDRNVRYRGGELDIVAYDGDELVFIEVKCRRSGVFGLPEESITRRRYEHLRLAAEEYRVARDLSETPCRVDVLAIEVGPDGRVARSRLLRNVEPPASR